MIRLLVSFVLLVTVVAGLPAQATVDVSPLDHIYEDIDLLIAHGLVSTAIIGQRPFSRREIARIIVEASRKLDENRVQLAASSIRADGAPSLTSPTPRLSAVVSAMRSEYSDEIQIVTDSASRVPSWRARG